VQEDGAEAVRAPSDEAPFLSEGRFVLFVLFVSFVVIRSPNLPSRAGDPVEGCALPPPKWPEIGRRRVRMEVGLIGCGGMGMSLAGALNATGVGHIAAVADVDADRARASAEKLGARAFTDHHELLAGGVSAVIVASPPFMHRPLSEDALAAGCHVFVEKPLAPTLADCDAILKAAETAGRTLMVGQVLRYYPTWRHIRERVAAGAIGRPIGAQVTRVGGGFGSFTVPWRRERAKSGGMLMEVNAHEIDFLCEILGEPRRVYAAMGQFLDQELDYPNLAFVSIHFSGGGLGLLHASMVSALGDLSGKIEGEAGTIFYQDGFSGDGQISEARHGEKATVTRVGDLNYEPPVQAELRAFIESASTGAPPPITGAEGRRAVAVAIAAYRSAEEERPVGV
jgi:predicted dehydrogenase